MARLPLEDIRVLDFGWVMAGPHGTRLLADLGAQVIKVESRSKLDGARLIFLREEVPSGIEEGGGLFQEQNRNKMGLCLNLKVPKGREILEKLVKVVDVVAANFDPRGFKKLGLEFEQLREFNSTVIVANISGMGHWGPYSDFMAFGPNLHALAGMTSLMSYTKQEPVGTAMPWADYIGGATLAMAILAALEYRRKTGKGQFIDISLQEVVSSCLGINLLDWAANKKIRDNCGNHHPAGGAVPHNCYKCKGDDSWCVISVASDTEWEKFCDILGNPDWTIAPKFETHLNRVLNQEELDKLVEAWTVNYSAEEVVERMQQAGISAGVVQNIEDLLKHDSHLREREFLIDSKLPDTGKKPANITLPGVVTRFSGIPLGIRCVAPAMGQDNNHILKVILGMTQEEIDQATLEGALY
jgi:crotonobetainyl-CoA:carnitine CoA-transferase CaiB-like acyl-CoA transferase